MQRSGQASTGRRAQSVSAIAVVGLLALLSFLSYTAIMGGRSTPAAPAWDVPPRRLGSPSTFEDGAAAFNRACFAGAGQEGGGGRPCGMDPV